MKYMPIASIAKDGGSAIADHVYVLSVDSPAASTRQPSFSVPGLPAGSFVELIMGADLNCGGGNIIHQQTLGSEGEAIVAEIFPMTDPEPSFRVFAHLPDGSTTCTSAGSYAYSVATGLTAVSGGYQNCGIYPGGIAKCWGGMNNLGQLGNGTTTPSDTPVPVAGLTNAVSVVASQFHACALISDGTVKCWGYNGYGMLGDGTNTNSLVPVDVVGISNAVEITLGSYHSCARLSDGTVKCWGGYNGPEVGAGSSMIPNTPVVVANVSSAIQIDAGQFQTCVVETGGAVKCWGYSFYQAVGDPGATGYVETPVVVPGITATQVSAGGDQTCALLTDSTVKCWGRGAYGALGTGSTATTNVPGAVIGLTGVSKILLGRSFSCALVGTSVECWGAVVASGAPTAIPGMDHVVGLADSADLNFCAYASGGRVLCYGNLSVNPVDYKSTKSATPPGSVRLGGETPSALAVGYSHACALVGGHVKCWGSNTAGQLGDGTTTNRTRPVAVTGITTAVEIAASYYFTCARLADQSVKCWGYNGQGQLGDGTTTNSSVPLTIPGLSSSSIRLGNAHACALNGGTVKCWGNNANRQLGDGTTTPSSTPLTVAGVTATAIAVGGYHSCALEAGGMKCWGGNAVGQLGDGTQTTTSTPVAVAGLGGVPVAVHGGSSFTCATMADLSLKCWGHNFYGQTGNGNTANPQLSPQIAIGVTAAGATNAVALGDNHVCVRSSANAVQCFGDNSELVTGTTGGNLSTPTTVPGLAATLLSAGYTTTCAVLTSGETKCWGNNLYGQWGDDQPANAARYRVD